MRVGLMVPAVSFSGDAVSRDVLGMYQVAQDAGYEPVIYAWHAPETRGYRIEPYEAALGLRETDLLIYHYCTGDQKALDVARKARCRVAMKYHNVTPYQFFDGYSDDYMAACIQARTMLSDFARIPGLIATADSDFNKAELTARGLRDVSVIPPFHQTSELVAHAPRDKAASDVFNVITVGRLAPNKGLEHVIGAFRAAESDRMRLTIIGKADDRLADYTRKVRDAADGASNIAFVDSASVPDLGRLYRNADAYLTCSFHEGFCVPVVEAMAFGVPVIASRHGALPETCGKAGIICEDEAAFAKALGHLASNPRAAAALRKAGSKRYRQAFTQAAIARQFKRFLRQHSPSRFAGMFHLPVRGRGKICTSGQDLHGTY